MEEEDEPQLEESEDEELGSLPKRENSNDSLNSTRAQPASHYDEPPAVATPVQHCTQNPREIHPKSHTPIIRHVDVVAANTLTDAEWKQIRQLGITPRELQYHQIHTWKYDPYARVQTVRRLYTQTNTEHGGHTRVDDNRKHDTSTS